MFPCVVLEFLALGITDITGNPCGLGIGVQFLKFLKTGDYHFFQHPVQHPNVVFLGVVLEFLPLAIAHTPTDPGSLGFWVKYLKFLQIIDQNIFKARGVKSPDGLYLSIAYTNAGGPVFLVSPHLRMKSSRFPPALPQPFIPEPFLSSEGRLLFLLLFPEPQCALRLVVEFRLQFHHIAGLSLFSLDDLHLFLALSLFFFLFFRFFCFFSFFLLSFQLDVLLQLLIDLGFLFIIGARFFFLGFFLFPLFPCVLLIILGDWFLFLVFLLFLFPAFFLGLVFRFLLFL